MNSHRSVTGATPAPATASSTDSEQTGAEDISSTGETKGDVQNDKPMLRAGVM